MSLHWPRRRLSESRNPAFGVWGRFARWRRIPASAAGRPSLTGLVDQALDRNPHLSNLELWDIFASLAASVEHSPRCLQFAPAGHAPANPLDRSANDGRRALPLVAVGDAARRRRRNLRAFRVRRPAGRSRGGDCRTPVVANDVRHRFAAHAEEFFGPTVTVSTSQQSSSPIPITAAKRHKIADQSRQWPGTSQCPVAPPPAAILSVPPPINAD